jgi:hypothetical protein
MNTQRHFRTKKLLTSERIKRLDAIGFSWDPRIEQWEEYFSALEKFCATEGHCRVSQGFSMNGLKLGGWVNKQRQKKHLLKPGQIRRLNSLGFIWKS